MVKSSKMMIKKKKKRYIDLKKGIIEISDNEYTDNVDGVTADDFGIELEDTDKIGSIEGLSEDEIRRIEDAKIKAYEEQLIKEMKEKRGEGQIEYSLFDKLIAKIKGQSLSNKDGAAIVEFDQELLAKYGYPKKVMDPTDVELDEDGKPQYFFNIKKTLKKHNMEWIMKIISEDRLIRMTYDDDFFDKYADKQHRRAFNYNNMSPTEQYLHDRKQKIKVFSVVGLVVLLIAGTILFNKLPEYKYKDARMYYDSAQYEKAYDAYSKIKGDTAEYYKMLSFVNMSIENGKYEDAIAAANYISENNLDKNQKETGEAILSNVLYQQGLDLFKLKQFNEAKNVFKEIIGYKDAETYYNKSIYEMAEEYFEKDMVIESLAELYKILDYEDAYDRFDKIASLEYNKAVSLYNKKEYTKAKDIFSSLADFKYKNSYDMYAQCNYKKGFDLFKDKKYDEAIKELSLNRSFKDSNTIINESIYRKANDLLLISPAKANIELSKIRGYRDVEDLLKLPLINLYGEWEIVKADGNNVKGETFVFNVNRKIVANKPIKNLRVSSPGDNISYNWSSDKFVSEDELSTIEVTDVGDEKITILVTNQGSSTVYECVRKNTLFDYMGLNRIDQEKDDISVQFGDDDNLFQMILDKYVN